MSTIRSALAAGGFAAALLAVGCTDQEPTGPDAPLQLAKGSKGLRVTPAQLDFTALGEIGTLTAATPASGAIVATVSTPACVSVTPRRLTRSPAKFTVAASAAGTCNVIITDGAGASAVVTVRVVPLLRGTVVNGIAHTCGLTGGGAAYCWGRNRWGQLGSSQNIGTTDPNPAPVGVQGGLAFTRLTAGLDYTCGLTGAGAAYCWGSNIVGELGSTANSGEFIANPSPVQVASTQAFVALEAGSSHTCGLTAEGVVYCWGYNLWGQVGGGVPAGVVTPNPTPVEVAVGVPFAQLEAGENHTCALTAGGEAYCWGRNNFGQLGTDLNLNTATPTTVPQLVGGGLTFTSLAAGGTHTCGLIAEGSAYCWGNNERGALGTTFEFSTGVAITTPIAVEGGLTFSSLAAGDQHTCGVTAANVAYCWGRNLWGQLGSVTEFMGESPLPLPVSGGFAFIAVSAAENQGCGVNLAGAAYCWGDNLYGQLGTATNSGTGTPTTSPEPVGGGLVFAVP